MRRQAIRPEEVKVLDINSAYLGVRTVRLMEGAGAAVARQVLGMLSQGKRVAVLCGKGNNGGDGFVAARHIAHSAPVDLYLAEAEDEVTSDIARINLARAREHIRSPDLFDPSSYDVIVDALLGVGLEGKPREPYARLIKLVNRSRADVVSVDVPSGWPSDLHVKPTVTVTLHAPKTGMTKSNSGKIVVADIGIPQDAELYCGPGEFALLPRRMRDAHKGDAGRVLVVGGGPYTGAPSFSAMAAMRSGADLAFVMTPEPAAIPVSIYSPNIIVHSLSGEVLCEEHVKEVLDLADGMDAVAIGPGLGSDPGTLKAVRAIVRQVRKPLVIDADAIAACGSKTDVLRRKQGVITPHAEEFKKLTGKAVGKEAVEKRAETVRQAAHRLRMTVLLKGPVDVISDGAYTKLNRVHNDGMTVGGTGDVLTGAVAGFIAQGASPFAAARLGAFTVGLAGNMAFEELSYGLLATDVIDKIPYVVRRYL